MPGARLGGSQDSVRGSVSDSGSTELSQTAPVHVTALAPFLAPPPTVRARGGATKGLDDGLSLSRNI